MRSLLATISLLALSGCATSVAYRADYLPEKSIAEDSRIHGRVLVYTTRADDERLVTAGATSFTGSAAKLTPPVGMIAREVADLRAFQRARAASTVASAAS